MTTTKVLVKIYDRCKYEKGSKKIAEVEYEIVDFEIVSGQVADLISGLAEDELDEYSEYLVLKFEDGDTATFRNSHVDLFRR